MTEIDKLFEKCRVKKCNRMLPCPFENQCEDCEYNWYPDFTAEKQIELIKWLSKRRLLNITFCDNKNTYQLFNNKCTGSFCSDLAIAITTLVQCELDLCTEEEKEEIRRILNENS